MKLVEDNDIDQKVQTLLTRIPQEVDRMVAQLKSSLLNPITHPTAKRGLWDRFKGTLSNFWWGRYNQDNPYFWKNKLGDDLSHAQDQDAQKEGMMPVIPIKEYMLFKAHFDKLEEQLNLLTENIPGTENLAIIRIITNWGEQLKELLANTIKDHIYGTGGKIPTSTPKPSSASSSGMDMNALAKTALPSQEDFENQQRFIILSAKQLKDRKIITDKEYQQLIDAAQDGKDVKNVDMMKFKRGIKGLEIFSKRKSPAGTSSDTVSEKNALKKRLEALKTGIEEDAYKMVLQKIKDDDLDGAERDIERFEKASPAPVDDSAFNDKKQLTIEALEKAKERGLPDEKYEFYKKAINGAIAPDVTTLDRVMAELQRTAVAPSEEMPSEEMPSEEDHEYDSSYVSYWDRKPNSTGEWATLQPSEKLAWNNYGGGIEKRVTKGELGNLHLPWILRIGDPRQKLIYNRRKHIWNQLESQGRIESPSNPIDSRQEFEARLKRAKELKQKYKDDLAARRKRTSDVELAKQNLGGEDVETGHDEVSHDPRTEPKNDRTVEAPVDSLPPNLPTDEDQPEPSRTTTMDEPPVEKTYNDKLKELMSEIDKHKDKLSQTQIEKLTNIAMGTDEEEADIDRASLKLARIIKRHGSDGNSEVQTFENSVKPYMGIGLRERVEYFKTLIRRQ